MSTIIAKSASETAIKEALAEAKASGASVVQVPAGRCDLSTDLAFDNVTLQGADKDLTQFVLPPLVVIWQGDNSRFTGFEVVKDSVPDNSQRMVSPTGQGVIQDHCRLKTTSGNIIHGIFPDGRGPGKHPTGVAHHNEMLGPHFLLYGAGLNDWSSPSSIGNPDQTGVYYFEDNYMELPLYINCIDCGSDAKFVFRYNVVNGNPGGWLEVHSNQGQRNGRNWEIYNNEIDMTNMWASMLIRGGTGVCYGNKIIGPGTSNAYQWQIRIDNHFGQNGTGTYYMKDQIGRGRDKADGTQELEPAYFWSNVDEFGRPIVPVVANGCDNIIQENRDYYNSPRVGYVPYAYPHALAVDTPVPPEPIPPEPPANLPPEIRIFRLKNGSNVLDPAQPMTLKNVTIEVAVSDDVGVVWTELSIDGQKVKESADVTMTYNWKTAPYKGKTVDLLVSTKDADGSASTAKLTVTVTSKK